MTKTIHIDYRRPRTKFEREVFGYTLTDQNISEIFINLDKNKDGADFMDTFFHELAHTFVHFHGRKFKLSAKAEERLAQQIGRACMGIIR